MVRSCVVIGLFLLLGSASAVHATDAVLVQGAGTKVTASDIQADAQRMPAETRKIILSKPDSVAQMGSGIYLRRALAAKAEREGLAADPLVAASLQAARDRALSDIWLARLDAASTPPLAAQNALAETMYKADPKRFDVPEQVRVRHLLVTKGADARARADKLLADLKAGANFADLAKVQSEDPGSAAKGGDLGFFARGRMAAPFDEAAFALKEPGSLSGLVETQFGVHIIQLIEKRPAGIRPFVEVQDVLRREVVAQAIKDARLRAQKQVMDAVQLDQAAIDAFSAQQAVQ